MGGKDNKSGFTIVEVILVLAIAGLIFMMVFLAVPSLRRSQRDAQRREDMLLFIETIKEYQRNNRGALPNNGSDLDSYLGANFRDPDGGNYEYKWVTCFQENIGQVDHVCNDRNIGDLRNSSFQENSHTILIIRQATCDGSEVKATSNPRRLAVLYRLEGGGEFCANT